MTSTKRSAGSRAQPKARKVPSRDLDQVGTLDTFVADPGSAAEVSPNMASQDLDQVGTLDSLENRVETTVPLFPGARAMGLPFRTAVETFLREHYGPKIKSNSLRLSDLRYDRRLSQAIKSYKERFKVSPFDIPSTRDIALARFNRVVRVGFKHAERRDRDAANRIAARIDRDVIRKHRGR